MKLNEIYQNMDLEKYRSKFERLQSIIGTNIKTILEIGGHYGEDTLRFYKFFPRSQIYSFEPDPRNRKIFNKTCQGIDSIHLIESAVSDKHNELVSFYMSYSEFTGTMQTKYNFIDKKDYIQLQLNNSGSSSLKQSTRTDLQLSTQITVPSVRLDKWCIDNKIDSIDFIWIDVQGAEKQVIEGCLDILDKIHYIQLEYGETSYEGGLSKQETYNMMISYNFELVLDYNPSSHTGDFLFVNKKFSLN